MGAIEPYYTYSRLLQRLYGQKTQKISVNIALPCPNRDGTLGRGGCTYCTNRSFAPEYTRLGSVAEQIERGKRFFEHKGNTASYVAYFQSHTPTNAPVDVLQKAYTEALSQPDIKGLVIGTRPDCMPDALLDYLAEVNERTPVIVEYGAESAHDATLRAVNRCHTHRLTEDAIRRTAQRGITCGVHLIMGLPGETHEMMLQTIDAVNALPVQAVKIHQLQILKGTRMAEQWASGEISLSIDNIDSYLDLCVEIVRRLRADIAIDRFVSSAPAELRLAPNFGVKPQVFNDMLIRRLAADLT